MPASLTIPSPPAALFDRRLHHALTTPKSITSQSQQDGKTWQGGLMHDERVDVTYPDGVQAADGTLHIIYDRQRTPLGEIVLATFREEDVRAGKIVSPRANLRQVIDLLPPSNR